jgi:hypothetical protein
VHAIQYAGGKLTEFLLKDCPDCRDWDMRISPVGIFAIDPSTVWAAINIQKYELVGHYNLDWVT